MQDYLQRYLVQVENIVKCIKFQAQLNYRGPLDPGPWSPRPLFLPTPNNKSLICDRICEKGHNCTNLNLQYKSSNTLGEILAYY